MRTLILTLLIAVCTTTLLNADDNWAGDNWPRFRGPNADGVAPDNAGLPTTWSTTENVKWVADVPGWGWSCPVVWGDRVFLTSVISDEENTVPSKGLYQGLGVHEPAKGIHHWMVYCFDLNTGKELWKHEAHTGRPKVPRHPKSTYASETPTTDGERLYVLFGDLGLYCYDFDGKPLWSRKIDPKKTLFDYGAAASPVVHDGRVIVVYDNFEDSWIAAFDAKTGKERWRTPRKETHSWATPFVWKNEIRTEIVVPGQKRNRGYSLDGKVLWEFNGKMSSLVIPSPFAAHGLCYIASGYVGDRHRPTFAVKPGGNDDLVPDGDLEKCEHFAWYQGTSGPYNPSQIVYGDYLYTLHDRGFLTCHDAKTGKEIYGKQRFKPLGSFTASPFAYNDRLFCLSEDGLTYVVKPGPEFEIVGRNDLEELTISSPAVVGDKLLIRAASKLYCLTEGAKLDAPAKRPAKKGKDISADALKRAKAGLHKAVELGEVAGGVHMVVMDGKVRYLEAAGVCDVEDKRPFKPDTLLRIYSMTKPITSVAAMTLFEQGKFQLDDPVSKFIPEFEKTTVLVEDGDSTKTVPARRQITIRDVFRHTTGFNYAGDKAREYYEREGMILRPPLGMLPPDMTIEEAAAALARIPGVHHPGERFTYSFSTDLLGRLIEVWSGKPLDEYLRQTIFEPLEMVDTGFSIPPEKRERFASCHTLRDGKLAVVDKAADSPFNDGFAFLSGGGGLISTIQDYANFCQMLIDGGEFKGERILKEETVKLMFTNQLEDVAGNFRFGLGFAISDIDLGSGRNKHKAPQYFWSGYASTDFRLVPEAKLFQIFVRQRVPFVTRAGE